MKKLIWKFIVPITIISFAICTKWWYVLPVDAPDTMMSGYPLIWVSDGWHTSLSLQIFVLEFLIDFVVFFLFWFVVTYFIHTRIKKITLAKYITILLLSVSGLIILGTILIGSMPEHIYKLKRDFDIKVLDTGYKFIWENQKRPILSDYE